MKTYSHPAVRDIPLHQVMQALSDPCRLAIVRQLLASNRAALACHEIELEITKATRSHHFDVLRSAGIILTKAVGTECMTSVRQKEIERQFPGLLKLVLGRPKKVARTSTTSHRNNVSLGAKKQRAI